MNEPRPYQNRAHAALQASVRSGKRRVLLVSPTGSGKTFMLSRVVAGSVAKGKRVAWFAHRRELITQPAEALAEFGVAAGYLGRAPSSQVQILSVQGSVSRGEVPPADVVILDEAHHFAADLWKTIPEAYPDALIIGATATPERGDGKPLDHLFDDLIVVAQPGELVESGHLVPVETHRPARIQPRGKLARTPVEAYVELGLRGRRNIVFAPNVDNAQAIAGQFRDVAGIVAHVVTGDLSSDVRDQRLRDFMNGTVRVLINVYVLTEGFDCPATEVVTLARMFGSAGQFMQCVGRGLRTFPGKTHCTLIDLVGATHVHGDPVEDRIFSLSGEGMARKRGARIAFCRVCGRLAEDCACGAAERDTIMLESTNDPLVKFARIRRDNDDERAVRLARWIGEARGRGNKWQSALYRYKGAYGAQAPAPVISQALAIDAGKAWCGECKTSKCEHVKGAA